jgi:hypothetical protein
MRGKGKFTPLPAKYSMDERLSIEYDFQKVLHKDKLPHKILKGRARENERRRKEEIFLVD